jgi:DNA-directed RNA polymerase subunit N (RpoN/RPB10)
MKIPMKCYKCEQEVGENFEHIYMEVNDSNYYKVSCSKGHETVVCAQNEKFEILFDMGIMALIDGYTREAVVNFASSLERYFEFYIEVFCNRQRIKKEEFDKTWKMVSNQSERQMGAFLFMYLNNYKKMPKYIPDGKVNFRNRVVHKAYIPKYEEVIEYGECIYNYLNESLIEMREHFSNEIITTTHNHVEIVKEKYSLNSSEYMVAADSNSIILMDWNNSCMSRSFEEVMEQIKKDGLRVACG